VTKMLVCFALLSSVHAIAMEQRSHEYELVEGRLSIVPNPVRSALQQYSEDYDYNKKLGNIIIDPRGTPLHVTPDTLLAQVWVRSPSRCTKDVEECECMDWSSQSHPRLGNRTFPDVLPLSLVDNKNEGGVIEFDFENPETSRFFHIRLICDQLKSHHNVYDFQTMLATIKRESQRENEE
jgi:hypothetical protein